ncbi:aprataxin-like [Amphiura filiformis]|uniref:aprataxin-like n=1 Tax=Amphiura filiformis TaxID=82378 RepID=UPI003B213059
MFAKLLPIIISVNECRVLSFFTLCTVQHRVINSNSIFKMSSSGKRPAGDHTKNGPPAKKGHWSMGLLDAMKDPQLQVHKDDKVVIIKDKYPKAEFHYLVLPKQNIPRLKALKPEHLDLLKHMHKVGDKIIKEAMEADSKSDVKYRLGYHAVPSMSHLHLHAISQDFNSPSLKTKKHWNSFTSDYFVDSIDVMKQLEEHGKVDTSARKPDELLKLPLRCHVCKISLANIPKLKAHMLTHLKSR